MWWIFVCGEWRGDVLLEWFFHQSRTQQIWPKQTAKLIKMLYWEGRDWVLGTCFNSYSRHQDGKGRIADKYHHVSQKRLRSPGRVMLYSGKDLYESAQQWKCVDGFCLFSRKGGRPSSQEGGPPSPLWLLWSSEGWRHVEIHSTMPACRTGSKSICTKEQILYCFSKKIKNKIWIPMFVRSRAVKQVDKDLRGLCDSMVDWS